VRPGHHARIAQHHASTSDSRRAFHDSALKALPVAASGASRHARGFASLALSAGYLNKEIFSLRLGGSCYVLPTVQPGTAMTVKEMGPASATGWAFT